MDATFDWIFTIFAPISPLERMGAFANNLGVCKMKFLKSKSAFAIIASLAMVGCSNSALIVESANTSDYRTSSAEIAYDPRGVEIDQDNQDYTADKMSEALFGGDNPIFAEGDGMSVKYRYMAFDEGSQALRYLMGPIAGGSKVLLEVDFVDPSGNILATVRGEGSVSGGFFGGSNKSGIDGAIKKIAAYAEENFAASE